MGKFFVIIGWKIELLTLLCISFYSRSVVGITLTVSPSSDVEVNKTVTLTCKLDPNPIPPVLVTFSNNFTKLCSLLSKNGNCNHTISSCDTLYNASCSNETLYSLQVTVHQNWSGESAVCKTLNSTSNRVLFSVIGRPEVTSRVPSPYIVSEGQLATLECAVTAANPSTNITWRWFRSDRPYDSLHYEPIYKILSIHRNQTGPYSCTASNFVGTSEAVTTDVDVQFKPVVIARTPSPFRVMEGKAAILECLVTAANPSTSILWKWSDAYDRVVLNNGPTYTIFDINRTRSGYYNCTASNSVGVSEAATIDVDVLYKPLIVDTPSTTVKEGDRAVLTKEIDSNPLSNVSWYDGSDLLGMQMSVRNATLIIEKAECTDTKNFTLVASNQVKRNVSALVELIVYCKPRSYKANITLGVTDTNGIEFSTTVLAYPEPSYELRYENGTINNQMMDTMTRNAVNKFTIHFNQTVVEQSDYGTYRLLVTNLFGQTVVVLNVLPIRKPNIPVIIEVVCEVTRAKVEWMSSFNGGNPQSFTVFALNVQHIESQSETIADIGENKIHYVFLQNLQSSTKYLFYVSAQNSYGFSSSENISCTTLKEPTDTLPFITGGAVAGGMTLAIVVIVVVFQRLRKQDNQERNADRNNTVKTNEDASHYTTLAERDVTTEKNFYEMLTQNEGANQYEVCMIKENRENDGQTYESLKKNDNTDKRNLFDKQVITQNTKDLSKIYVNHSVTENSAEYTNLSFPINLFSSSPTNEW